MNHYRFSYPISKKLIKNDQIKRQTKSQMRGDFLERVFIGMSEQKQISTEKEALETELSVNLMACRGSLRLSMLLINTLQHPSANAISKRRSTNTFSYF